MTRADIIRCYWRASMTARRCRLAGNDMMARAWLGCAVRWAQLLGARTP